MLQYFKKYRTISMVLGSVIPVLIMVIWLVITKDSPVRSVMTAVVTFIGITILTTMAVQSIVGKKVEQETDRMLSLYNNECDPYAFVEAATEIASGMHAPFNDVTSWFLSFYALALLDCGRVDDAAEIGREMQESLQSAQNQGLKVILATNIEPLVLRLFGAEGALQLVESVLPDAESLAQSGNQKQQALFSSHQIFLESEHKTLQYMVDNDQYHLLEQFTAIFRNERYPMRLRAMNAKMAADLCNALGQRDAEIECLRFAADNGGRLPFVEEAAARLKNE